MKKMSNSVPPQDESALAPHNLPYQLFLLVQQMTNLFQTVLRPHALTPLHWGILCCLWEEDGLRTSELTRRLQQLGGTITIGLDAMVRDGVVERRQKEDDKRVTEIFLTDHGRELRVSLEQAAERLIGEMFSPLTAHQYGGLRRTVGILRKHLGKPGSLSVAP